MEGLIYAFINFEQACRFGHIGWGFRLDDETYCFGSSDHLYHHNVWDLPAWIRYMNVPPGGDIDWWCERGSKDDMLATMSSGIHRGSGSRHIRYHSCKAVNVPMAAPARAEKYAQFQRGGGWSVYANNCVHHAYQIFFEYGAGSMVPDPNSGHTIRIPKTWFALMSGTQQDL